MKVCDCCGEGFEYGELTSKTDGHYTTVKLGDISARVCIDVKANNGIRCVDICPACRVKAIEELLGESIPRHSERRHNQYRLRN